jgi:hypothetical protein
MRRTSMLLVLWLCGCGKAADPPPRQPAAQPAALAPVPQPMASKPAAAKMAMIEVPADKRQLERLLAAGYTVHDKHMHPPGVKNCPFEMGGGVVQ